MLLQRCLSVPIDAVKFTASNGICIAASENAQQTDNLWIEFARIWLPICAATWENPGFVYVDGHSSHLTMIFIEFGAKNSVYVIVEPSHTSMVLQIADVGVNRFIKTKYAVEYTASMCSYGLVGRSFDDTERIACAVRAILALKQSPKLVVNCFLKAGLLAGLQGIV